MADTQIDELRLDITVEDNTSGESSDKKVKNLATAISRLNKTLQAFDNAKFSKTFENMTKGIDPFISKIEKVSGALESLATIVKKSGLDKAVEQATGQLSPIGKETVTTGEAKTTPIQAMGGQAQELSSVSQTLKDITQQSSLWDSKIDNIREKIAIIQGKLNSGKLTYEKTVQLQGQLISLNQQIENIEKRKTKELEKQQKIEEDTDNSDKKKTTSLGKLLKSFGRIAMYRAVRRTIQEITQAFMESIDGIAKYNSEFRDTMGSLQSSLAKVKASIGVSFYQVLILLEPVITQIANGISNLANSLAKVTANMRGVANYTKINTKYMQEYKSATQGTLLAFDTFTTLSSNQQYDPSKMFEEGTDALDEKTFTSTEQTLQNIFSIVGEIIELIKTITPIIEPLINAIVELASVVLPIIVDGIKSIMPILKPIIESIVYALKSITNMISGISKLIKGDFKGAFEDFGQVFKDIGNIFASTFETVLNWIINAINILLKPINWIGRMFGAGENFAQISNVSIGRFAEGGMMTRNTFSGAGTMYALAGESGAEVVAQGSAGTGVLNVDQFADAMVSALVRYGAARDTGNGTTIVLDGNKVGQLVASNVGFRNEANRRNANLNWK